MNLEITNKLFLELSQFATATTAKELALQAANTALQVEIERLKKLPGGNPLVELQQLRREMQLLKDQAASGGGDLRSQLSHMSILMIQVATALKLPLDKTLENLPAWAAEVMKRVAG